MRGTPGLRRHTRRPVLTGFANALIVALVAFKVPHVTAGQTATVDGFIVALAAMFVHTQGSPRLEGRVRNRPIPVE